MLRIKFIDTKDIQWDEVQLHDMIASSDQLIFSTVKHGIWQLKNGKAQQVVSKNVKNYQARFFLLLNDELMYYLPNGRFYVSNLNKKHLSKQMELRVKHHHSFGIKKILITTSNKIFKWSPNGFLFLQSMTLDNFQKVVALNEFFFIFLDKGKLKFFQEKEEIRYTELEKYNIIDIEKYDEQHLIFATQNGYFVLNYIHKKISKLYTNAKASKKKKIFVHADKSIWLIENDNQLISIEKAPFDFIHPVNIQHFQPRKVAHLKSKILVGGERKNWVLDVNLYELASSGLPQEKIDVIATYQNQLMWVAIKNRLYISSHLQKFYPLAMPQEFSNKKESFKQFFNKMIPLYGYLTE